MMADLQDRLARIQAKITALKEKDPDLNLFGSESHAYKLNQPLSNQTLTSLRMSIKLPYLKIIVLF